MGIRKKKKNYTPKNIFMLHTDSASLGRSLFCGLHNRDSWCCLCFWWLLCKPFFCYQSCWQNLPLSKVFIRQESGRTGNGICRQRTSYKTSAPHCQKYYCSTFLWQSSYGQLFLFRTSERAGGTFPSFLWHHYSKLYPSSGWPKIWSPVIPQHDKNCDKRRLK